MNGDTLCKSTKGLTVSVFEGFKEGLWEVRTWEAETVLNHVCVCVNPTAQLNNDWLMNDYSV